MGNCLKPMSGASGSNPPDPRLERLHREVPKPYRDGSLTHADLRRAPPLPGEDVPGANYPMRRLEDLSPAVVHDAARMVYEKDVLYHGTNGSSKKDIQGRGFQLAEKRAGVSSSSGNLRDDQRRTNYFSIGKRAASGFARTTADHTSEEPALVRILGRDTMHLQPNHMNIGQRTTPDDYPVEYKSEVLSTMVLRSKSAGPQASHGTAAHFQRLMAHRGAVTMTKAQAAQLLNDVQSDSDEDEFPAPRS